MKPVTRRSFLRNSVASALGAGLLPLAVRANHCCDGTGKPFDISLAQWSLHRALRAGTVSAMDFPALAKREFGIEAVEYVNQFYREAVAQPDAMAELKRRADDAGVRSLLIMVDGEGNLGEPDAAARQKVVENHYKWVEAAALLGCHSIRVNAGGPGSRDELAAAVADGLQRLSSFAASHGLNVIVENHGGFSSDAAWLAGVMQRVAMDNCGTLPDFGNFCIRRGPDASGANVCLEEYDRYRGVAELMPFAKAVSAKSYAFDEAGNETLIDYPRMMRIVLAAGYHGHVGIEYEGGGDDEYTGIRKTRDLLLRIRDSAV